MAGKLKYWPAPGAGHQVWQIPALCCALLLLAHNALAANPSPYGEYFFRLGAHWPDAGTISPPPPVGGPAQADSASFQHQLEQIEEAGGPYADALAEPLADLARLLRRGGDLARAQRVYLRALHVVRINEGLYSERQVPILRELFETYRTTGDLASLDARYGYFFRLYGSGEPPYTPVRIGAALEYMRWQREALRLGLDKDDARRLLQLYTLNERILEGVAADPAVDLADYRALVLSQLRNLYLIQDRYQPKLDTTRTTFGNAMPGAWDEEDADRRRIEITQRSALSRGREMLQELIARTPPEQVEALAGAWLELADWNQWNDRRSEALAAYGHVVKLLRGAERDEVLQQWLGEPVELPANGAFWQPRQAVGGEQPIVVRARFDVSASGKAGNIEATALASEYESKASRLRRNLAQTRFRPRMVNGEPEATLQLQRDYEVLP